MSDDFNVEDYIESTLSRSNNNINSNIDSFIKDIELQSRQNGHKDNDNKTNNAHEKVSDSVRENSDRRHERRGDDTRGKDSRERDHKKDNNVGRDRKRRDSRDRRRSRSRDRRRSRSRDRRRSRSKDKRRSRSRDRNRSKSRDGDKIKHKKEDEVDPLTKDQRTVFVSQLTAKVNEIDVKAFFEQVGTVKKVTMVRDKNSGKHKGFAYIEMSKLEVIPNCLLFNNIIPNFQKFPILVQGSQAEKNVVARIQKESADGALGGKGGKILSDLNGPDTRIYIGNIHTSINEAALATVLEPFGELLDIRLHRDETGTSKGFAFAKFAKPESSKLCIAGLNGVELVGRPLKVNVVTSPDSIATNAIMGANNTSIINNLNPTWKIDDEAGAQGFTTLQRQQLMQSLGQRSGITVPMPVMAQSSIGTMPYNGLQGTPSCYLLLSNMFDLAQETEPEWNLSLEEEVVEECNKYGLVESCMVETLQPGGYIYLKLNNIQSATNIGISLNGRYFSGRTISASFMDENTYNSSVQ